MIEDNDLEDILSHVLEEVKEVCGFANLAEIERRTGISRCRLRKWQKDGYHIVDNRRGRAGVPTKLAPYEEFVKELLAKGCTNSEVLYSRLNSLGYDGCKTSIKNYVRKNIDLVPAKRMLIADPKVSKGMRYYTEPGDCFQMDWGFVNVQDSFGNTWKCACFAMVCHHCGFRYIEFFPNAKQEQLFIGMIHSFMVMGIPERVLTDNMASVVIRRDAAGQPIWNKEYDAFQHFIGFRTDLCKVAHPFTKGKVERLVQYVKSNFVAGRSFLNVTDLNRQALAWCIEANSKPMKEYDFITIEEHRRVDMMRPLPFREELLQYLAPPRKVSFDGFIEYEGRRFGIPFTYGKKKARVFRKGNVLHIIDIDDYREIQTHPVDWSKKAKIAEGQWSNEYQGQPEEHPTAPVKVTLRMDNAPKQLDRFSRFNFKEVK